MVALAHSFSLTSALANLAKANKDVEDFLAAQEFSYGEGDDAVEVKKGDATEESINAVVTHYENAIADTVNGDDENKFQNAGEATKLGLIEDKTADLDKAIKTAEEKLAAAEKAASNTLTAIAAVESRKDAYGKDYVTNEELKLAERAEEAKFKAFNAGASIDYSEDEEATETQGTIKVGENTVAKLIEGKWTATTSQIKGLADYIDAKNARLASDSQLANSENSLKQAMADVINIEKKYKEEDEQFVKVDMFSADSIDVTESGVNIKFKVSGSSGSGDYTDYDDELNANDYLDKREELSNATNKLAEFNKAIDSLASFNNIESQLSELDAKVTAAENHIKDADTGLGITLISGGDSFTSGDDAYLFNETESADKTLTGFGQEGDDKIYLGDSYDGGLVEITSVKDSNGALDKKEVFWEQDGDNVNLYVEQTTFAGNGTTASDMVKLTLSGVKGDDLRLDDDGYLSLA